MLRGNDRVRVGLVDAERADLRPPQRAAVPAERLRDRPDVRPRAHTQVDPRDPAVVVEQLELVDDRAANRHLDLRPTPSKPVRALPSDLDRRVRRDRQLDLAAQPLERGLELLARRRLARIALALGVARRADGREVDVGHVALVQADEPARELRRTAE